MIDLEDIFKAIIAFLMEELPIDGGGTISRLNYFINEKNVEKGDSLLEYVTNDETRFVLNQRMKEQKLFSNWIDVAVAEDVDCDANFDTVAKSFLISVNSLMYDDLSQDTFYKSVRMTEVLKNAMVEFFKIKQIRGFMFGEVQSNALPDRVSSHGTKSLMSGVKYILVIQ